MGQGFASFINNKPQLRGWIMHSKINTDMKGTRASPPRCPHPAALAVRGPRHSRPPGGASWRQVQGRELSRAGGAVHLLGAALVFAPHPHPPGHREFPPWRAESSRRSRCAGPRLVRPPPTDGICPGPPFPRTAVLPDPLGPVLPPGRSICSHLQAKHLDSGLEQQGIQRQSPLAGPSLCAPPQQGAGPQVGPAEWGHRG